MTTTYMEMTAPDQLLPGRPPALPLELERIGPPSASRARPTYDRVGAPHHWSGRSEWRDREWEEHLARPEIRSWLVRVGSDVAGMVELETHPDGDVEIITFGLVPEFIGQGLGGHFLTLVTRAAWGSPRADGTPPTRVWLHTNSLDHPHAVPNYERRGFRPFRTEHKQREIPG